MARLSECSQTATVNFGGAMIWIDAASVNDPDEKTLLQELEALRNWFRQFLSNKETDFPVSGSVEIRLVK